TAVLTPQETKKLFVILNKMKAEGHGVVIITHKLNEVMEISDRVTILRGGKSIDSVFTDQTNVQKLTEMMVGYPVNLSIDKGESPLGKAILNIHQLSVKNVEGHYKLRDVNFSLHEGEILGVAGIAGSGQKELCEAIAGLQKIDKGSILLDERQINGLSPKEIIDKGISMSFIPEDRLGMGLVGSMGMVDNLMLKTYKDEKGLFMNRKPAKNQAKELIQRLEISTPGIYTPVQKLSGGNVQKVLLGREIDSNPRVLITAYPVRGLDINSSHMIYDLLIAQKQLGKAVLYIGEDLDVLIELCDRILVLCGGEMTAIIDTKFATKELIGLKMTNAVAATESEEEYA
ncbi:MAG: ATP-binding cassette domain-containing protein, partial [Clostridiales bacterium]|nr:ATP-binding cassette domain-containing protein [Clostridiales bacterium]